MAEKKDPFSETLVISYNMVDRATDTLRSLIRASHFKEELPPERELSRILHLPRSSIVSAFNKLQMEGLLEPSDNSEIFRVTPTQSPAGKVAFFINSNILEGWYALFQDFLIGFDNTFAAESYQVLLESGFDSLEDKIRRVDQLHSEGIMGFGFASFMEKSLRHHVLQQSIPSVVFGNATIHQDDIGCVSSDNQIGIHKLLDHLLTSGHERIAMYVSGLQSHDGFSIRFETFLNEMRAAGLTPVEDLAFKESHSPMLSRRAADIVKDMDPRPTAIICACDREAFELISELQHHGISVPDDISVAGFEDNHFARTHEPPLTTVNIHSQQIGRTAANYLLNEMQRPQLPIRMVLPTYLVERQSTRPLDAEAFASRRSRHDDAIKMF